MPLQRRKPVQLLPLPDLDGVSEDTPVFYLKATGEIFLDYESYAARLSFLLSRTFQCEYSGKSHLDYFSALQSEKQESKVVRERFPNELKARVLASVQYQVMGRLDKLVDLVYDRYKDRYFVGEKVFVDLSGDKYYARIAKVFPPQAIRDQHQAASGPQDDFSLVAHKAGTDLDIEPKQASARDPASEYLYTVQLMDEEHKFEGSFMEVKQKALSRDRLTFSKSILKRYMRECVQREGGTSTPWTVRPSIARALGIETRPDPAATQEVDGTAGKRKKGEDNSLAGGAKKRRTDDGPSHVVGADSGPKKAVKYPIEDLDLDPMTIHDGRVLRRTKTEVPTLPPKPVSKRTLPVDREHFDLFLETWNMLNTFSKPLALSPFTMDDYVGALTHSSRDEGHECVLLAELHASLTNIIGTDASRVLGSSSIMATMLAHGGGNGAGGEGASGGSGRGRRGRGRPSSSSSRKRKENGGDETPRAQSPANGAGNHEGDEVEDDEEEIDELDENDQDDEMAGPGEGPEAAALSPEEIFFGKLIKRGIQYGKRWDRQAKLKSDQLREGWERHLIGAICQRGGPYFLDRFEAIMTHLFQGDPILAERDRGESTTEEGTEADAAVERKEGGEATRKEEDKGRAQKSSRLSDAGDSDDDDEDDGEGDISPEDQYLTLPLADKLSIIHYLITLVMGSKPVRAYLEEADKELTELRKQRADVNKERKALLERKLNEDKKGAKAGSGANGKSTTSPSTSAATVTNDLRYKSPAPTVSRATSPSVQNGGADDDDGEDEDELVTSDNESSIAPSEAGSVATRQAQKEEKLAQKRLSKLAGSAGSARSALKGSTNGARAKKSASLSLDEQIEENASLDDLCEKQFRRFLGVSRCRPLGKDRFHCRYWWFDGIGGMDISKPKPDGARVPYATGRIFVQGPSELDWEVTADDKGDGEDGPERQASLIARRLREEVAEDEQTLIKVGEWGYYETPQEFESLLSWLNAKGTRELALTKAITRWRDYIVAGSLERQKDLEDPTRPRYDPKVTSTGRPSRTKAENELPSTYLGYRNEWKRY